MSKPFSYYTKTIAEELAIPENRARLVEGHLRLQYGTLDALSRTDFWHEYYEGGIGIAIDEDPTGAADLADSYGL